VIVVLAIVGWLSYPSIRLFVLRYIVIPLRARGEREPRHPEHVSIDMSELPEPNRRYHQRAARQAVALGFTAAAHLRSPERPKHRLTAFTSAWLNPAEGTSLQVISVHKPLSRTGRASVQMTFCTEFTDETAIITSSSGASVFVRDPLCDSVRWPTMNDAFVLYRLHAQRVARVKPGRQTTLPAPVDVQAYMRLRNDQIYQRQQDAGYFWFDPATDEMVKTLKGALIMYWKLLWPWKQRIQLQHAAKLRRVLMEVGMGQPEDYPARPFPPE
jgi:hypothetical protein